MLPTLNTDKLREYDNMLACVRYVLDLESASTDDKSA